MGNLGQTNSGKGEVAVMVLIRKPGSELSCREVVSVVQNSFEAASSSSSSECCSLC